VSATPEHHGVARRHPVRIRMARAVAFAHVQFHFDNASGTELVAYVRTQCRAQQYFARDDKRVFQKFRRFYFHASILPGIQNKIKIKSAARLITAT
jgi:hypothetical protein